MKKTTITTTQVVATITNTLTCLLLLLVQFHRRCHQAGPELRSMNGKEGLSQPTQALMVDVEFLCGLLRNQEGSWNLKVEKLVAGGKSVC